ncbi:MAG: gliding motility protein GldM [Bacteroidales bacterium]|nr:gliding motility protein GldM [Bacteroidales bacterium]
MSGAKETPRQKMIGMMYLVYTALLAMNVSKDILNAFDIVNTGVQETNYSNIQIIDNQYNAFQAQYSMDQEKVGPYWQKAQNVRTKTDSIINYVEALKWELTSNIEKPESLEKAFEEGLLDKDKTVTSGNRLMYTINTSKVKSRDNFNDPTSFLIDGEARAYKLSKKIDEYRTFLMNTLTDNETTEAEKAAISKEIGLQTNTDALGNPVEYREGGESGDVIDWERYNFYHTVLIADITLMNKIVSEIQTAERMTVNNLAGDIHATDYTFDEIGAKVFAESKYVVSGQPYKAQAMVTAWKNSQITAKVSLDGGPEREYTSDAAGVINLDFNSGIGSHRYTGVIEMRDPKTNELKPYEFSGEYVVTPPSSVSVSATKMNVVYAGIPNPISVAAGGSGTLSVTANGATLTPTGNGTYDLMVAQGATEVTVNVSRSEAGNLGSMKFRVKDLPKPTALIRNVVNGQVSKSALVSAGRVEAEMKDFDFEGVKYDVVGYTVKYRTKAGTNKEAKVNGAAFSDEIKSVFNSSNAGDLYIFTAIQVKGNDGKVKTLDSQLGVEIK